MPKPIVHRYEGNALLTPADIPYEVETVHNAGMAKYDGKYMMLFRAHRATGRSILGLAESGDGFHFVARPEPFMVPVTDGVFAEYEAFGVEDPRICALDGTYYITYSAYSQHGVRIGLAKTSDFRSVQRVAMISQADMRNVVLFPQKFDGRYARLDRPHSEISPWAIWISYSEDLIHWGDSRVVMKPVKYHWDEMKIGPGAPPFKTENKITPYGIGLVGVEAEKIQVAGIITETDLKSLKLGMEMETTTLTMFTNDEKQDVVTWAFRAVK